MVHHIVTTNNIWTNLKVSYTICRCTRNRGASVHLLEGPIAAHLHRHVKIFINTPRAQDPHGGASREEVQDTIGEGLP